MPPTDRLGWALLARARNAVAAEFNAPAVDAPGHPALELPGATFVTLFTAGTLHGCVGSLDATRALADDVRSNALAAAFRDPRFASLTAQEFAVTRFEVSLLGPTVPVHATSEADAIAQLVPYRDGVTLWWGDVHATLLPQVWASLSDPRDFVRALKRKAGLPYDFWATDVRVERYTVTHFDESTEPVA